MVNVGGELDEKTTGGQYMNVSKWMLVGLMTGALLAVPPADEVQAQALEVPHSVTHQGRLVDDEGQAVTGDTELTYTIYDAATGGAVLWQQEMTADLDDNGFYTVELGGAQNPMDSVVLQDGQAWLGLSVDGDDEMEPRLSLNSVPFALIAERAGSAESADHADHADTASIATMVADEGVNAAALTSDFSIGADQIDDDILGGMSCSSGEVARFDGNNWFCDTAVADDDPRLGDERDPTAGSEHYIHNQDSSTQEASFDISGDATVGGRANIGGDADISGDTSIEGNATIEGELGLYGGDPGEDKVLTSDADGNASWQEPSFDPGHPNDVSSDREFYTWYHNDAGRPLMVYVSVDVDGSSNAAIYLHVNDTEEDHPVVAASVHSDHTSTYPTASGANVIVPADYYYKVDGGQVAGYSNYALTFWVEQGL